MHLTVLSRSSRIYTTRRLAEAARERGHKVKVVDPLEVDLGLGGAGPVLYHRGRRFPRSDAVVPRVGLSINQYGLAVVNQLELSGVPVLNGARAISATRNKMRCLQLLAASGVRVPTTVMASNASGLKEMVRLVGGMPVLVKLVSPGEKTGVMVCETLQSLEAALEAIQGLGQNVIVQQYLLGGRGRDLRLLVVGGRVVAALRRRPRTGRMSRTLASGARFEAAEPRPAMERVALAAARIVGLEVCAVDMLEVKGGLRVFEVNSSPGIREAEEACGVDVAAAIVERAAVLAARAASRPAAPRAAAP
ncbi:MAG TPA: RimK family alpha-L-glutamate ligase [Anaeromyxobacteraceae bacterium]|nr:RimK family alpha-L-glutamate ligase [Anaeromyxobacteraceae bacterium]